LHKATIKFHAELWLPWQTKENTSEKNLILNPKELELRYLA
jgi:hypothetical protein